jgi:hypothetical protein
MWLLKTVGVLVLFLSKMMDCLNSKNLDIDHPQVLHSEVDSFGFSFAMIRQKSGPGSW